MMAPSERLDGAGGHGERGGTEEAGGSGNSGGSDGAGGPGRHGGCDGLAGSGGAGRPDDPGGPGGFEEADSGDRFDLRILPCADHGLLIETTDLDEVIALNAALTAHTPPGVTDIVPAARTVLLRLAPGTDLDRITAALADLRRPSGVVAETGEKLTVPVHYDGADLDDIAAHTGLSPREVVAAHTSTVWTVAFCGFAPGFGYLVGGDPRLDVPRRPEPRTRVPGGAVALAGRFTGVYPRASPGGWQLLGRTELTVWNIDRDPPGLLRPGTRVQFEEAG